MGAMVVDTNQLIERTRFSSDAARATPRDADLGGQFEWFWGVPDVLRAVSFDSSYGRIPAAPLRGDPHPQSLGYWSALQQLLLYRLGWTRPDRGLMWWYDAGKPTEDPTLRLVAEVWDADGNLDVILAWLLRRRAVFPVGRPGEPCAPSSESGKPLPDRWHRWLQEYLASPNARSYEWINFLEGDSLHLSGHLGQQGEVDSDAYLLPRGPSGRQAVFVTSAADSWYLDLKKRGDVLPVVDGLSWKVDVFVKPIGFVGTYRRSFKTGLWFSGRHRYHVVGT
ncbi:hypothetical protein C5C44_04250 [Rathayibacter sp. AY1F6]|nr:hypothetical protein C5C44_04250 [Rathayibacter sp. AY1F6]